MMARSGLHWLLTSGSLLVLTGLLLSMQLGAHSSADEAPAKVDFEKEVAPLLLARCLECHSGPESAGKLNLTTAAGLLAGGESGPVIVAGQPAKSLLLDRVRAGEMPPPRQGKQRPLAAADQQLLQRWIEQGTAWPERRVLDPYERSTEARGGRDWWSFQPLSQVTSPVSKLASQSVATVRTPIDPFILERLQAESLTLAPPAERRQLLRRLSHDLVGLPPTAEALDEFAADDGVDAYERRVDRLLAAPAFGERWARFWLDLARYADTCGYERDQDKPHAWRYRDWVILALNQDLPYDDFVRRQIAGDEIPQRDETTVIATGFLRLGTWNDEPNDPLEYQYERLEDLVHVVSTAFLSVTVKCARCHDHKFDPIPQQDYYRIAAAFWAGPVASRGRELLGGPSREELGFDVLGWTDLTATPPPLQLLKKGDPLRPQAAVEPGYLSLLPQLDRAVAPPPAGARTSQRRRQLAEWLVETGNPLTPRVAVNRLWLHHFGQALVRSPNNFGFQGERPTHPELLDFLAREFQQQGWQSKPLHRLLVTSAVYRQASTHPQQAEFEERDYLNRWWWRAERRRLDAESLRDAILASAGQLDRRLGGPSFKPTISAEALEGLSRKSAAWAASPPQEQLRRAIYIYSQRSLLSPLLTTFDFADTTLPCGQRDVSTVAPQALALLNNPFLHEQSLQLARRLTFGDPRELDDPAAIDERLRALWRSTLGRAPTEQEEQLARGFLLEQLSRKLKPEPLTASLLAWTALGQVLLNSNEFIYVD
ncbi:MAG: PSD1 and planctomycete cytochrome C domain-containing protein [Planctomycetota bacterium]